MISLAYSSTFYKSVLFCCAALRIDLILTLWNLYLAISENFSDAMESTLCDLNTTPPPTQKKNPRNPFGCVISVFTLLDKIKMDYTNWSLPRTLVAFCSRAQQHTQLSMHCMCMLHFVCRKCVCVHRIGIHRFASLWCWIWGLISLSSKRQKQNKYGHCWVWFWTVYQFVLGCIHVSVCFIAYMCVWSKSHICLLLSLSVWGGRRTYQGVAIKSRSS